ncbi:MAG: hypothetical protein ACR5K7_03090 [Symbiopectobacterium sp.]
MTREVDGYSGEQKPLNLEVNATDKLLEVNATDKLACDKLACLELVLLHRRSWLLTEKFFRVDTKFAA